MTNEELEILVEKIVDRKINAALECMAENIASINLYPLSGGSTLSEMKRGIVKAIRDGKND